MAMVKEVRTASFLFRASFLINSSIVIYNRTTGKNRIRGLEKNRSPESPIKIIKNSLKNFPIITFNFTLFLISGFRKITI
jgi:hypothetical protein